jgi:hypothetical protein
MTLKERIEAAVESIGEHYSEAFVLRDCADEIERLSMERDCLRALASTGETGEYLPLSWREAVARGDLAECRELNRKSRETVKAWQEGSAERDALKAQVTQIAAQRDERKAESERLDVARNRALSALGVQEEQTRFATRERDALKARVAELEAGPEAVKAVLPGGGRLLFNPPRTEAEEWRRITGYDSPSALDFALGRMSLDEWIAVTQKALTAAAGRERDEWKEKAEAAEARVALELRVKEDTKRERDAARADCAALRGALTSLVEAVEFVDAQPECLRIFGTELPEAHAALSTPNPGARYRSEEAALVAVARAVVAAWDRDEIGQVDGDYIDTLRAAIAKAEGR